ncbi:MAG: aldo/keto reductase [Gemmatimonadota bacterium]|jgi:diketogulonate reductase-like aldo/keto reductase
MKDDDKGVSRRDLFRNLGAAMAVTIRGGAEPGTGPAERAPKRADVPGSVPTRSQDTVLRRRIPSSGEEIPAVGLGTWRTFDVGDGEESRAPLRDVLSGFTRLGGSVIDSSPMYGRSEAVLGELTAELGLRPRLFLATKVWTRGRDDGVREMQRSLELLRSERIELMQVHNLVDAGTHLETLAGWKHDGRVRYIGVTHYRAEAYAELERALTANSVDFVQLNYSLGERDAERRLLDVAADRGVAVLVNRPFTGSALFSRVRGRTVPAWAAEFGARSWAQFFLKWILSHPAVSCAIPATSDPHHLEDNMGALRGRLPDPAERVRMTESFDSL